MSDPLLDDIRTMPTGYQEFLNTAIPAIPAAPADVEAAQLVCGQLAQYLLNVFSEFAGLHPLKIPYYMGQGNEAVLGLLQASLETSAATDNAMIQMINPTDGGIYYGAVTSVSCTAAGAESVSVQDGEDVFDLTDSGGTWSGDWAFAIGAHSITVTASYPSGESTGITVNFAVYNWDTYPIDGATLPAGPTSFELLNPDGDPIESVTVEGIGDPFQLVANEAGDAYEWLKDMTSGAYSYTFKIIVNGIELISDIMDITIIE